jgi:hypothetical protein
VGVRLGRFGPGLDVSLYDTTRNQQLTWEREGEIGWWVDSGIGRVSEQQVLDIRLSVSFD